jgi:hypothetical protein
MRRSRPIKITQLPNLPNTPIPVKLACTASLRLIRDQAFCSQFVPPENPKAAGEDSAP